MDIGLKNKLIQIWENYIIDPKDKENISKASKIYSEFNNAIFLDENQIKAISCLIDIIGKTGIRVSKEKAREIIDKLNY